VALSIEGGGALMAISPSLSDFPVVFGYTWIKSSNHFNAIYSITCLCNLKTQKKYNSSTFPIISSEPDYYLRL
jgi:hypothetical protein